MTETFKYINIPIINTIYMARPSTNGDEIKKELIRKALKGSKRYLSEISRMTKLHKTTVHKYINEDDGYMRDEVVVVETAGTIKNKLIIYYALRK